MTRLPGLKSLTLASIGARTLPHLRPLNALTQLSSLDIVDSPVSQVLALPTSVRWLQCVAIVAANSSHACRSERVWTHADVAGVVQLVLFRPFVAVAMPSVMLLNGIAVDSATRDTGQRVIAPLMQYCESGDRSTAADESQAEGSVEFADSSGATSMCPQQQPTAGWGLKSVQQMSQMRSMERSKAMGATCSKLGDAGEPEQNEDITPDKRRAIEKRVEAAVARAIEVERRWAELDACWDSVVAEILQEWKSELA